VKDSSLPSVAGKKVDKVILQVALRPQTGIWTLMRELLLWQNQQEGVLAVGGYLGDAEWIRSYGNQLDDLGVPFLFQAIPSIWHWGVERHLRQIFRSPVNRWVTALHDKYRPHHIAVHFHDTWLSGGFLPVQPPADCPLVTATTFNGIPSHELFRSNWLKRAIHKYLARRLVQHSSRLISVDRCNLRYAQEFFGLQPELFTIIPNTVRDLGLRGCPHRFGTKEFVVGHVGSVTESKGWRILAEAVLQLAARGQPVRLLVAGDGEELPVLQQLSGKHPQIITALGRVSHAGRDVIPRLDVLGLVSRWEGQPLCILEALCCGVPVIATNVGGVSETIVDGESGFIVGRDAGQTAERIAQLMQNPALHMQMGEAARATFLKRFHIDQVGAAYLRLWNQAK
jgi:glycosyltransferase involved in cell wall biosynthesis